MNFRRALEDIGARHYHTVDSQYFYFQGLVIIDGQDLDKQETVEQCKNLTLAKLKNFRLTLNRRIDELEAKIGQITEAA